MKKDYRNEEVFTSLSAIEKYVSLCEAFYPQVFLGDKMYEELISLKKKISLHQIISCWNSTGVIAR